MATQTTNDGRASRGVKTSPLNDDFQVFVQETMEKWHIQGLAIAVIDGDETWSDVCTEDSPTTILTER